MAKNELKPCPFCGSPADISRIYKEGGIYTGTYGVFCTNVLGCSAGVEGEYFSDEDEAKNDAIQRWNRRVNDENKKKEDGLHSIIRCRQCKYYHEAHYEDPGDPPYIKHQCKNKYGMNKYTVRPDEDYCSRAEKREGLQ